jgi:hypothetical protein
MDVPLNLGIFHDGSPALGPNSFSIFLGSKIFSSKNAFFDSDLEVPDSTWEWKIGVEVV